MLISRHDTPTRHRRRSLMLLAAGVAIAAAGCNDPIEAPTTTHPFWQGRGTILYTQNLGLTYPGDVHRMKADGSGDTVLQSGVALPCRPHGDSLVVINYTNVQWRLGLARLDRASSTPIDSGSGRRITAVAYSPVGDRIAIVLTISSGTPDRSELRVLDISANGFVEHSISSDVVNSAYPVFSPDGTRIAYYSGKYQSDVVVYKLPSGPALTVATNARPWTIENLDWSADSDSLIYVGGDGDTRQIFMTRASGSNRLPPRQLTDDSSHDNHWPVFSPDGAQVAFVRNGEIWTMRRDGTHQRQATFPTPDPYPIKMFPEWSPDMSMILYTAVGANAVAGLLQVVDLATLRVNVLAPAAARGFWQSGHDGISGRVRLAGAGSADAPYRQGAKEMW